MTIPDEDDDDGEERGLIKLAAMVLEGFTGPHKLSDSLESVSGLFGMRGSDGTS